MIIAIIVILFLLFSTKRGWDVGFTKRLVSILWNIVILIIAGFVNIQVGTMFANTNTGQFDLGNIFTKVLIQIVVFSIVMFFGRFIGRNIFHLNQRKISHGIISTADRLLGAVVSLAISFLIVFVILNILNFLDQDWFINQMAEVPFLRTIIYQSPITIKDFFSYIFQQSFPTINL